MALYLDGAEITGLVYVDGVEMANVYIDGVLVWSKPTSGEWILNWSGSMLVAPQDSPDFVSIAGAFAGGALGNGASGVLIATAPNIYTNMVNVGAVSDKALQANANYMEYTFYPNGESEVSVVDTLTAPLNNFKEENNLPWGVSNSVFITASSVLPPPTVLGSAVEQSAALGWSVAMSMLFVAGFEITALYYYEK